MKSASPVFDPSTIPPKHYPIRDHIIAAQALAHQVLKLNDLAQEQVLRLEYKTENEEDRRALLDMLKTMQKLFLLATLELGEVIGVFLRAPAPASIAVSPSAGHETLH
jgi:hypothetical protein